MHGAFGSAGGFNLGVCSAGLSAGDLRRQTAEGVQSRLVLRDVRGWPDDAGREALASVGATALVWSDEQGDDPEGGRWLVDGAARAREYFDRHGIHAYVVRPDFAIYGVATTPEEVPALIDSLAAGLRPA